jgi:hypothetical protein
MDHKNKKWVFCNIYPLLCSVMNFTLFLILIVVFFYLFIYLLSNVIWNFEQFFKTTLR